MQLTYLILIVAIVGIAIPAYMAYPGYVNESALLEERIANKKVEITSSDKEIHEETKPIISTQYPPIASIDGPPEYDRNEPVTFSGIRSYDPNGDEIISYFWTIDDGKQTYNYVGSIITHSFRNAGPHVIVLKVQDNTGLNSFSKYVINILLE
jgi:uncharacterized membrane protein